MSLLIAVKRGTNPLQRVRLVKLGSKNGLRTELFQGLKFEKMVKTRIDSQIDWLGVDTAPDEELQGRDHSIRWDGWLKAPKPGRYNLSVIAFDGVRLSLDGKWVIDKWKNQLAQRHSVPVDLGDRPHHLRLEYYGRAKGRSLVSLRWELPGVFPEQVVPRNALFHDEDVAAYAEVELPRVPQCPPNGLNAKLYQGNMKNHFAQKVKPRVDAQVDWFWGEGSPDPQVMSDHFGVRWGVGSWPLGQASIESSLSSMMSPISRWRGHPSSDWRASKGSGAFPVRCSYPINRTPSTSITTNRKDRRP